MSNIQNPHVDPWDRQPGESTKQYSAFCDYLKLGPSRSIVEALRKDFAENGGKSKPLSKSALWRGWSASNDWVERATAWDTRQEKMERAEQEGETRKLIANRFEQERRAQVRWHHIVDTLMEKFNEAAQLPRTDTDVTEDLPDGSVRKQKTRGLHLSEMARVTRAILAVDRHLILGCERAGNRRVTQSSNSDEKPRGLILIPGEWPDEEESTGD